MLLDIRAESKHLERKFTHAGYFQMWTDHRFPPLDGKKILTELWMPVNKRSEKNLIISWCSCDIWRLVFANQAFSFFTSWTVKPGIVFEVESSGCQHHPPQKCTWCCKYLHCLRLLWKSVSSAETVWSLLDDKWNTLGRNRNKVVQQVNEFQRSSATEPTSRLNRDERQSELSVWKTRIHDW